MPSYVDDDLISLADSVDDNSVIASPASPHSLTTLNMAANGRKPIQRDSFFDLARLMKAKKPYPHIPSPSPRPPLSVTNNGMQFASRVVSSSSILSPLTRPYHADGSVAAYLQEQTRSPMAGLTSSVQEYKKEDMQRLESILREAEDLPIDDDNDNATIAHHAFTEPTTTVEPLIPGFDIPPVLPICTGPIAPPTPAESINLLISQEPVVRVTMDVWNAMGQDKEVVKDTRRALKTRGEELGIAEQAAMSQDGCCEGESRVQIRELQHQTEANKNQKATMDRALSSSDIHIEQSQFESDSLKENLATTTKTAKDCTGVIAECGHLQTALQDNQTANSTHLADLINTKNCEIETLSKVVDELQNALRYSKIEHEAADVHANVEKYKTLAQNRLDQLNQREKLLRHTQERYAAEHTKVKELEERLKDLQGKLSQVDDLQDMLREKSSECDRSRAKLKNQEKMVEDYKQRALRASDNGAALRGAAHLVKPQSNTKFTSLVLGCSECYAKNISCDNKARCRYCTENNEKCARWRCSLKHIVGFCPDLPCRLPHDDSGWLLQADPRPQW